MIVQNSLRCKKRSAAGGNNGGARIRPKEHPDMSDLRKRLNGKSPLYLMILPGLAALIVFSYFPLYGITIAFKDFMPSKGIMRSPGVGWEYFQYMLSLPDTYKVLGNTLLIAVKKIVFGFPVPIITAIFLNEITRMWYQKTVQTIIYLPNFISWVILGGMLKNMLSTDGGMINNLIGFFGIDPIYFLGSNTWFQTVLVTSDIWKGFGFSTIVYLAAITSIDPELYEAAKIDGANWRQSVRNITIPCIMPIVVLVAILSIGNILNANFDQVFNMYNVQVYETGDIIDTFVYRISLVDFNYSLGTAVGLFKSVVSFILLVISYTLAYKYSDYRIF
jgi:putative aldouronate transport system permease protein